MDPSIIKDINLRGIDLGDGHVEQVAIRLLKRVQRTRGNAVWYEVSVQEGRNRIIRRIFEKLGTTVEKLVRFRYGELLLNAELKAGEVRPLTSAEIRKLKRSDAAERMPAVWNQEQTTNSPVEN